MSSQTKVLAAPNVKDANNNQLKLSAIKGDAVTVHIHAFPPAITDGSRIKLFTKMGNAEDFAESTVTTVPSIIELKVRKSFFEENLASASSATFHYTAANVGGAEETSEKIILTVVN
ncbi:hypothetical protein [Pseudomonas sp. CP4]|uniref:hypothetical protein n=1 Tax=Pseudomonas sp. CP4 TaxID=3388844 RepID=UPI0039EF0E2D